LNWRRFAKEAYTIHQFIFSAVEVSFDHPVGVEVKYRKYVSDEYPEVVEDPNPNSDLGVTIRIMKSKTLPEPGGLPVNCLLGIPENCEIVPDEFVPRSRNVLDEVIQEAISTWSTTDNEAVENWKAFGRTCPAEGETAAEWIKHKGFHIPFHEFLVNPEKHGDLNPQSNVLRAHRGPPEYSKYQSVQADDLLLRSIRKPDGTYTAPPRPPSLNARRSSKIFLLKFKSCLTIMIAFQPVGISLCTRMIKRATISRGFSSNWVSRSGMSKKTRCSELPRWSRKGRNANFITGFTILMSIHRDRRGSPPFMTMLRKILSSTHTARKS